MKSFVRNSLPMILVMTVATLVVTALAGGSEVVLYVTALACSAIGLWWEMRRGAF
jgi:hypothetical protein